MCLHLEQESVLRTRCPSRCPKVGFLCSTWFISPLVVYGLTLLLGDHLAVGLPDVAEIPWLSRPDRIGDGACSVLGSITDSPYEEEKALEFSV